MLCYNYENQVKGDCMKEGFFHHPEFNRYGNGQTYGFKHDDKHLYIVKAMCSKKDVYSKKIGREQCRKMLALEVNCQGWNQVLTLQDIKDDILKYDELLSSFPLLTRDATKRAVSNIKSINEFSITMIHNICMHYLDGKGEYMQ